jgi:hypothetical protein
VADFTEPFNSLAAWDFGTGPTSYLTLATTTPSPYLGLSRGAAEHGDTVWAAAIFDLDDPNVPATTYWMSYAFYLDSWSDVFDTEFQYVTLPGFINLNDDPMKGQFYGAVDDVIWEQPYLEAEDASSGKIFWTHASAAPTEGVEIDEGQWHTVRYGLRLQGATSHETMYVDGVLVRDADLDFTPGGAPYNQGIAGVVIAFEDGVTNAPPYVLPVDTIMYSAAGDPGEPAEAGFDPPEVPGCGEGLSMIVLLDGVDVTNVSVAGGWTPRLNKPAQATITTPMEESVGDAGSRLMLILDDGVTERIVFHGTVLNVETDTDKDGGRTVYNAQDPMELWQHRPARDDGGDFSKPDFIEAYVTAPQIMEALLINTVDSTGRMNLDNTAGGPPPADAEGDIYLEMGTFEGGGVSVVGAPVDWPMYISEVFELLVSTGQLDVVITPIDGGTTDVMGIVDGYNGDYGTDRSADVIFQYGTGLHNVASLRWNRDMTNVVTKYWLYGGPRVQSARDPQGDQHWCFSVTGGTPSLLAFPPGGPLSPPASSTDNELGVRRFDATAAHGVRMKIDIFDAYDDDCIPGFGTIGRDLYERQWQVFSWMSAFPREIIHVTPNPDTMIGCFDIGDLITVEAAPEVRGGFAGVQRVMQYTVSWEGTPSLLTLSEIQTSADAEGSAG